MQEQFFLPFDQEPKEILVLMHQKRTTVAVQGRTIHKYSFYGYVDVATQRCHPTPGILCVRMKETQKIKTSFLRKGSICRIVAFEKVDFTSLAPEPEWRFVRLCERNIYDAQLQVLWDQKHTPVTLKDSLLGRFSFDHQYEYFVGDISWQGRHALLICQAKTVSQGNRAKSVARALFKDQEIYEPRLKKAIVTQLLAALQEKSSSTLSSSRIQEVLHLTQLTVLPNGHFKAYFNDDSLTVPSTVLVTGSTKTERLLAQIVRFTVPQ